jgi:hypothetical protein
MLSLCPMIALLLWLLWPGFHVGKPPLTEALLRQPPQPLPTEGLYLPSLPSAIPGAMRAWPAVATARLTGDSVVVWGYFLEQPLEGVDAAIVAFDGPEGTFRMSADNVRVLGRFDRERVLAGVRSFLEARGLSLWKTVLGYPVVTSTDVPFLARQDCGQRWCPQGMFWDQEREEILVRCHTAVLPNSKIDHLGHRDLGDRGVAWLRVAPRLGRVLEVRLTRIEVYWLE